MQRTCQNKRLEAPFAGGRHDHKRDFLNFAVQAACDWSIVSCRPTRISSSYHEAKQRNTNNNAQMYPYQRDTNTLTHENENCTTSRASWPAHPERYGQVHSYDCAYVATGGCAMRHWPKGHQRHMKTPASDALTLVTGEHESGARQEEGAYLKSHQIVR